MPVALRVAEHNPWTNITLATSAANSTATELRWDTGMRCNIPTARLLSTQQKGREKNVRPLESNIPKRDFFFTWCRHIFHVAGLHERCVRCGCYFKHSIVRRAKYLIISFKPPILMPLSPHGLAVFDIIRFMPPSLHGAVVFDIIRFTMIILPMEFETFNHESTTRGAKRSG